MMLVVFIISTYLGTVLATRRPIHVECMMSCNTRVDRFVLYTQPSVCHRRMAYCYSSNAFVTAAYMANAVSGSTTAYTCTTQHGDFLRGRTVPPTFGLRLFQPTNIRFTLENIVDSSVYYPSSSRFGSINNGEGDARRGILQGEYHFRYYISCDVLEYVVHEIIR